MPGSRTVKQQVGDDAERHAEHFLTARGLQTVARNHRSRYGEIDLVMREAGTLVFVEVRYRASAGFGGAAASIHTHKQRRIVAAAAHFLLQFDAPPPCRFDAVLVHRLAPDGIEWIRDAFQA